MDTPRPRRPFARVLFVLGIALAVGIQVFVVPPVGVADNGDFDRLAGWFRLQHSVPAGVNPYWNFADLHYRFHPGPSTGLRIYSSALPVVAGAVALWRIAGGSDFDIRWLGFLYMVLMALAAWIAFPAMTGLSPPGRVAACVFAVLAFADTAYVAYFNSFYTEAAAIVFFLLAAAFAARVATDAARDPRGLMAGFTVSAALFVLARPAAATSAPIAIAAAFLLARGPRERRRVALPAAGLLLLVGGLDLALTPAPISEGISYFSVFWEILPASPDRSQDLRELGLDPALAVYSGTTPWGPSSLAWRPEARRLFYSRVSLATVCRFYGRHPARMWQALERLSDHLRNDRIPLGNFDRSAGLRPARVSHRFSVWSSLKERILPRRTISWCLLAAAVAGAIAFMGSRPGTSRRAAFCALLLAAAALNLLVVAIVGWFSDSPRLLVPFHLSVDLMALLFLTAPFGGKYSAPAPAVGETTGSTEAPDNTR
jgi:hypothetical protein